MDGVIQNTRCDAFENLCEALDIRAQDLIVLVAYFDESYNHPAGKNVNDPRLYTVACCLSTKEEWSKFGVRWKSALDRKPRLEYFHMTDFENRVKCYADWPDSVRLERLQRFHSIMREHVLYNIGGTVSRVGFDAATGRLRRHRRHPDLDYYLFGTIVCMEAISGWRRRHNHTEPVAYVFSNLAKQGSLLDLWFAHCLERQELREKYGMTGLWSKGLMKHVPQLQAADILAYELNKRAVGWQLNEQSEPRESLINLAFNDDNCEARFYDEEEILGIFSDPKIESFDAN